MVSCRGSMAKAILCSLNLIFIFFALTILLVGLQMKVPTYSISSDQGELIIKTFFWKTTSTLLILFGLLIGVVSMFGFGAALCESAMLLNIYLYFLSVFTVITIVVTTIILLFNSQMIIYCRNLFAQMMIDASSKQDSNYASAIQNFQRIFHCCGIDSPNDWFNQTFGNVSLNNHTYPASCCSVLDIEIYLKEPFKACTVSQLTNHDGCFSSIQVHRYKIFGQMFVIVIILLLGLLLALSCCLERDRCLQLAQLVNLQYAAHLSNCRQSSSGISYFNPTAIAQPTVRIKQANISKTTNVEQIPSKTVSYLQSSVVSKESSQT